MSLVSVIIPCFNQGRFLSDAVESVLRQTYENLEVIIINDGSTDETDAVARAFMHDSRCKYVCQENGGLSAARNRGIAESAGIYLNFLDADDWLEPTKIEEQTRILDDTPDFGLTYCDVVMEYQDGEDGLPFSVGLARKVLTGNLLGSLLIGGFFPPHTVLLRREVLDRIDNFDPAMDSNEDYDLWLRAAGAGYRSYYLDKKLAHYRIHSSNMSKNTNRMRETRLISLVKVARLFPEEFARSVEIIQEDINDIYSGQQWLEQDRDRWQLQAQRAAAQYEELTAWVAELERGKGWLEHDRDNWRLQAEREAAQYEELTAWVAELERGKGWLEDQRAAWQAEAERLAAVADGSNGSI